MKTIQTNRLQIREFTSSDAFAYFEICDSDDFKHFIADRHFTNEIDALSYMEFTLFPAYSKYGHGMWIIEQLDTKIPVGMCGLIHRDTLPCPDLGFALHPLQYGKGYIQEAAIACLEIAKTQFNWPKVCAITTHDNIKCQTTLQKLGFKYIGPIDFPIENGTEELQYFEIELN